MASNTEALRDFFLRVIADLGAEAAAKNQKFPIDKLLFEVDEIGGQMSAPHYVQYILLGRGPGKFPPPEAMMAWVTANPDVLERAQKVFKYLTAQQLGYLIGRKIAREVTYVYSGKNEKIPPRSANLTKVFHAATSFPILTKSSVMSVKLSVCSKIVSSTPEAATLL